MTLNLTKMELDQLIAAMLVWLGPSPATNTLAYQLYVKLKKAEVGAK